MKTAKDILIVILLLVLVTMTCLQEDNILNMKRRVFNTEGKLQSLYSGLWSFYGELSSLKGGLMSLEGGLDQLKGGGGSQTVTGGVGDSLRCHRDATTSDNYTWLRRLCVR